MGIIIIKKKTQKIRIFGEDLKKVETSATDGEKVE
jgi:hypothetical protein